MRLIVLNSFLGGRNTARRHQRPTIILQVDHVDTPEHLKVRPRWRDLAIELLGMLREPGIFRPHLGQLPHFPAYGPYAPNPLIET